MRDTHFFERTPIADLYLWFADEAEPTSPVWGAFCRWVAATSELHPLLDSLPEAKRQPNLFLGALRFHGGPTEGSPAALTWVREHWGELRATILARHTQTNEVGRLAVLAPPLASLPQPLALLEVGSSAGLLLGPDRFSYRYDGAHAREVGAGPLVASAETGTPPSLGLPEVALRAGLDRNHLRADDPGDARWLTSLVWPGEEDRESRLRAALAATPTMRVHRVTGDALADLPELLALAELSPGATPVLMHSAMLAYLTEEQRAEFEAVVRAAGVRWLSFEGWRVVASVRASLERRGDVDTAGERIFVTALDGEPVAVAQPHGRWVRWLT